MASKSDPLANSLALCRPSPRVRSCPAVRCSRTRATMPCVKRMGSSCHAMSAAPVAGRGALRGEDGEEKSDANSSDFFPSLSLSSFSLLPLWHSTSSLTPVDASPRQSVTFRAPRGRHPTRALTPQTPGGGGREDALLCLCRRGWFREVDKMLDCLTFAPFWRPF